MTMTTFRKTIVKAAVLALGMTALNALSAMAQDTSAPPPPPPTGQAGPPHGQGGPGGGEHQLEFMTRKLNLTPDQVLR